MTQFYDQWYVNTFSVTLLAVSLSACSGIRFNDSTNVFKVPPQSFADRTIWHDPSVIQYKLQSLVGYMIQRSKGENVFRRVRQVLPDDFESVPEPIADGQYYHSLVNKQFVTEGKGNIPLLSAAASLESNQMMEITILDKALLHVDDKIIPWNKLNHFVRQNPISIGDERFWVQAALITQVLTKTASSVKSDAQVSGAAYQVKGKIFNTGETQDKSSFITMLLLDVDKQSDSTSKALSSDAKSMARDRRVVKDIHLRLE